MCVEGCCLYFVVSVVGSILLSDCRVSPSSLAIIAGSIIESCILDWYVDFTIVSQYYMCLLNNALWWVCVCVINLCVCIVLFWLYGFCSFLPLNVVRIGLYCVFINMGRWRIAWWLFNRTRGCSLPICMSVRSAFDNSLRINHTVVCCFCRHMWNSCTSFYVSKRMPALLSCMDRQWRILVW